MKGIISMVKSFVKQNGSSSSNGKQNGGAVMKIEIEELIYAGYPLIAVPTYEEDRFIEYLTSKLKDYKIFTWDVLNGMQDVEGKKKYPNTEEPVEAVNKLRGEPAGAILVMKDIHRMLENALVVRLLKEASKFMKVRHKHIIMVAPHINIPLELRKDVTVWDFELPSVEHLTELAKTIARDNSISNVNHEHAVHAVGLTANEAENVFSLSLIKTKNYDRELIMSEKLNIIRKSGLLEAIHPEPEELLGGFENLKEYVRRRKKAFEDERLPSPRGILLIGAPGTGKSLASKVTASILNVPLARLDITALKGSLVGQSEANMREALKIIDAVSPCVVQIDEIEKHISGVQSSARSDGGTTMGMFGVFLTWLQERKSRNFIVATANDITDLFTISQGALMRRFDEIFFVDLPDEDERREIIRIMNKKYGTSIPEDYAERMEHWSGAEIEKFVIKSVYDGIEEAFKSIRPLYYANREKFDELREWAKRHAVFVNRQHYDSENTETVQGIIRRVNMA